MKRFIATILIVALVFSFPVVSYAGDLKTGVASDATMVPKIQHVPQRFIPLPTGTDTKAKAKKNSGPFKEGESRKFRYITDITDPSNKYIAVKGNLIKQGKNINLWLIDDKDFHSKLGTKHNDEACSLKMITSEISDDMVANFDKIYDSMTDEKTGFAKHAKISYEYEGITIGDLGNDGKLNVLLQDINNDGDKQDVSAAMVGFFTAGDMYESYPESTQKDDGNGLDMINMDVGINQGLKVLQDNKNSFYSYFAHEFQHFLHFISFGAYYSNSAELHSKYLWFNEMMSGFAQVYYTNPGSLVYSADDQIYASRNEYSGVGYGDFLNFNQSLKNYQMGYLFAHFLKNTAGSSAATRIYKNLNSGPLAPSKDFASKVKFVEDTPVEELLGSAIKPLFGKKFSKLTGRDAFERIYFLYMENFVAEGGRVYAEDGISYVTKKFTKVDPDKLLLDVWGVRGMDLSHLKLAEVPTIKNNGKVVLKGYGDDNADIPASHDMMYKIGTSKKGTVLKVAIPKVESMKAYIALVGDTTKLKGADAYTLKQGETNVIETDGKTAYLFITTFHGDVDTKVKFAWESSK